MTTPLLHSIQDSTQLLGIGRSSLYSLIAEGEICVVNIGRRTLLTDREIRRYVESLQKDRDETGKVGPVQ